MSLVGLGEIDNAGDMLPGDDAEAAKLPRIRCFELPAFASSRAIRSAVRFVFIFL